MRSAALRVTASIAAGVATYALVILGYQFLDDHSKVRALVDAINSFFGIPNYIARLFDPSYGEEGVGLSGGVIGRLIETWLTHLFWIAPFSVLYVRLFRARRRPNQALQPTAGRSDV